MKKLAIALAMISVVALGGEAITVSAATNNVNDLSASARSTTYGYVNTRDGVGVNLRQSKSTSSKILAKIPEGNRVVIVTWPKETDNWIKVQYNGKTGYVARGYITDGYDAI